MGYTDGTVGSARADGNRVAQTGIVPDGDASSWAISQERESEDVLKRVLANAPSDLIEIIIRLAPHLQADELASVVRERFHSHNRPFSCGGVAPDWYDTKNQIKDGAMQVLLAHPGGPYLRNKDDGDWSIPKGEPGPEEDLFLTAQREFEEETGLKQSGRLSP